MKVSNFSQQSLLVKSILKSVFSELLEFIFDQKIKYIHLMILPIGHVKNHKNVNLKYFF